eukprot:GHVS01107976.1.p1 GENE.GHVS01107976.1~~GHVS01107976.1.p1  ORF type:complete len:1296 (-),score=226.44 GHVS01107976.1:514-4401(-)
MLIQFNTRAEKRCPTAPPVSLSGQQKWREEEVDNAGGEGGRRRWVIPAEVAASSLQHVYYLRPPGEYRLEVLVIRDSSHLGPKPRVPAQLCPLLPTISLPLPVAKSARSSQCLLLSPASINSSPQRTSPDSVRSPSLSTTTASSNSDPPPRACCDSPPSKPAWHNSLTGGSMTAVVDYKKLGQLTVQACGDRKGGINFMRNCVLGRSSDALQQVPLLDVDPVVKRWFSREHCSVWWVTQGLGPGHASFFVVDLSSSNGTFLNGWRLPPRIPVGLKSGDCIGVSMDEDGLMMLGFRFYVSSMSSYVKTLNSNFWVSNSAVPSAPSSSAPSFSETRPPKQQVAAAAEPNVVAAPCAAEGHDTPTHRSVYAASVTPPSGGRYETLFSLASSSSAISGKRCMLSPVRSPRSSPRDPPPSQPLQEAADAEGARAPSASAASTLSDDCPRGAVPLRREIAVPPTAVLSHNGGGWRDCRPFSFLKPSSNDKPPHRGLYDYAARLLEKTESLPQGSVGGGSDIDRRAVIRDDTISRVADRPETAELVGAAQGEMRPFLRKRGDAAGDHPLLNLYGGRRKEETRRRYEEEDEEDVICTYSKHRLSEIKNVEFGVVNKQTRIPCADPSTLTILGDAPRLATSAGWALSAGVTRLLSFRRSRRQSEEGTRAATPAVSSGSGGSRSRSAEARRTQQVTAELVKATAKRLKEAAQGQRLKGCDDVDGSAAAAGEDISFDTPLSQTVSTSSSSFSPDTPPPARPSSDESDSVISPPSLLENHLPSLRIPLPLSPSSSSPSPPLSPHCGRSPSLTNHFQRDSLSSQSTAVRPERPPLFHTAPTTACSPPWLTDEQTKMLIAPRVPRVRAGRARRRARTKSPFLLSQRLDALLPDETIKSAPPSPCSRPARFPCKTSIRRRLGFSFTSLRPLASPCLSAARQSARMMHSLRLPTEPTVMEEEPDGKDEEEPPHGLSKLAGGSCRDKFWAVCFDINRTYSASTTDSTEKSSNDGTTPDRTASSCSTLCSPRQLRGRTGEFSKLTPIEQHRDFLPPTVFNIHSRWSDEDEGDEEICAPTPQCCLPRLTPTNCSTDEWDIPASEDTDDFTRRRTSTPEDGARHLNCRIRHLGEVNDVEENDEEREEEDGEAQTNPSLYGLDWWTGHYSGSLSGSHCAFPESQVPVWNGTFETRFSSLPARLSQLGGGCNASLTPAPFDRDLIRFLTSDGRSPEQSFENRRLKSDEITEGGRGRPRSQRPNDSTRMLLLPENQRVVERSRCPQCSARWSAVGFALGKGRDTNGGATGRKTVRFLR